MEVVTLQKFSLFFRELLDGPPDPSPHLLELYSFIGREGVIGHRKAVGAVDPGAKDHREAGHRARDALDLVFEAPAPAALAIGEVAEVGVGALSHRAAALEHAHLAEPVVDGALDAVVSEGEEVRADPSVEALRGLEEPDLPPRDELFHLELRVELFAHLPGERANVGSVLLEDLRFGLGERQGPVTPLARPCSTGGRGSGPTGDRP